MNPASTNPAVWAVTGGVACVLLVALATVLTVLVLRRSDRQRARAADAARADVDALRAQVDELTDELRRARSTMPAALTSADFVITTAGETTPARAHQPQVPGDAVLSVTLGEPLVKLASWTYGVRRALSAENRNRIAFEMRREIKRSRKERRRAARRAGGAAARREERAA